MTDVGKKTKYIDHFILITYIYCILVIIVRRSVDLIVILSELSDKPQYNELVIFVIFAHIFCIMWGLINHKYVYYNTITTQESQRVLTELGLFTSTQSWQERQQVEEAVWENHTNKAHIISTYYQYNPETVKGILKPHADLHLNNRLWI